MRRAEALVLAGLYAALALALPWGRLFTDTILTGGDAGSWYQVLLHLRDELLPHGRLFGWDQDNFFGYPDFQYYFLPPFLLALALGQIVPLTVGLKLATVAGLWLTPLATWWALRALGHGPAARLAGAWLSLVFLFHERFTMFGGNLLSTLAGEFAFSLAFTLMVLFMGSLHAGLVRRRHLALNGVLLALTGLSHAFVFLTAAALPLYYLLRRGGLRHLPYLAGVYAIAFGLMAFWTFPLLADRPFTTPIRAVWQFPDLAAAWHAVHGEVIAAALGLAVLAYRHGRPRRLGLFLFMMGVAALWYLLASLLHIADIRFFPALLFFTLLALADALAALVGRLPARERRLGAGALAGLAAAWGLSQLYAPDAVGPRWFATGYAGYEATPAFAPGAEMDRLRVLLADGEGRVGWEHAPYGARFGTDRVFENLPLFTGRATTEGIHYASALLARAVTTLTAEASARIGSPYAIIYSHYDLDLAARHFRLFHINQFIAASPLIQGLMDRHPAFVRRGEAGALAVYDLDPPSPGLVEALTLAPLLCDCGGERWKDRFQAWLRRGEPAADTPLLVPRRFVPPDLRRHFPAALAHLDSAGRVSGAQRHPLPPAQVRLLAFDDRRVAFTTDRPGAPHLVKMAYSPHWRAADGSPLFPVSPGLTLVFPRGERLTLEYRRSGAEWAGLALTVLTLLALPWARAPTLPLARARAWCDRHRRPLILLLSLAVATGAILAYQDKRRITGDLLDGRALAAQGRWQDAVAAYHKAISEENLEMDHADLPTTFLALADAYLNMGAVDQARLVSDALLERYPNWLYLPDALAQAARIARAQGDEDRAAELLRRCLAVEKDPARRRACARQLVALQGVATP